MNTLEVFHDADCSVRVEQFLYEGKTYFLCFPTSDERLIKAELSNAGIEDFVSWHKLNPIATLRIVNRIGLIRIFGRTLDVRSEKLLESETGERQFKIILDDLALLSRHVLFESTAAPSAYRSHRNDLQRPSLLERFNYYRQTCLPVGKRLGLESLVEHILRNPHSRLINESFWDHVWNVRRPSRQTLNSLVRHDQVFISLPYDDPLVDNLPGLRIGETEHSAFPLKALRTRGSLTFDTPENRFIKHVLKDIEIVCVEVERAGLVSGALLQQCNRLLKISRVLLRREFFQSIGRLQSIPGSSPTLAQRHGYRELYGIFSRSRMGAKHIFEDLLDESLFAELKDIALLYEYWVFYKVVTSLLKEGAILLKRDAIVKNGRIVNSAEVTDGEFTVYFNKTFTRKPEGSYSLRLRPDIVIKNNRVESGSISLYVLDAKYKSIEQTREDDEELLLQRTRAVKTADIHKMHCYADAIDGVVSAVAVYPGTEFLFYLRDRDFQPLTRPQFSTALHGVGAVPLLPGSVSTAFNEYIELVKEGDRKALLS